MVVIAFAETQHLVIQLDLKGNINRALSSTEKQLRGLDRHTARTQRSLGKFGRNIERGVFIAGAAVAGAGIAIVNAASDYESAFAGVRKTVNATEPELQKLSDQFRELSKTIPISAAELATLGEAGGALGVPIADMKEFVRVTALLGVTTNLTAQEAADSLGVLGNVLHLTGQEYGNFASALVALGNAGASTEKQIVEIAERAGAAGELAGLTTAQVLGLSSAVASLGIESEAGGSALQKFFLGTVKNINKVPEALKTMGKLAGLTSKQFKKLFAKDAGQALQRLLKGLGKLSQGDQLTVLETLGFNDIRITRTLLGLANNTKLVGDQMDIANRSIEDQTALTKEAEQRFKTFDSQVQLLKNSLTDAAITIGSKLLPKLTPLVQQLAKFINEHGTDIEKFGDSVAAGFTQFADAVKKADFKPIIDGLRISYDIGKKAVDIFMGLPPEVRSAAIAALAINKVTGGLPVALGRDLLGLVLSGLKTITATNVTVIGANVVGGGGGIPGVAAGGGGGLIGSLLKLAVPIAVAAFIAEGFLTANANPTTRRNVYGTGGAPLVNGRSPLLRGGTPPMRVPPSHLPPASPDRADARLIRVGNAQVHEIHRLQAIVKAGGPRAEKANAKLERIAAQQTLTKAGIAALGPKLNAVRTAVNNKRLSVKVAVTNQNKAYFNGRLFNVNAKRYETITHGGIIFTGIPTAP